MSTLLELSLIIMQLMLIQGGTDILGKWNIWIWSLLEIKLA